MTQTVGRQRCLSLKTHFLKNRRAEDVSGEEGISYALWSQVRDSSATPRAINPRSLIFL